MFDISLLTSCPATAIAWRSVGVFVNRLVGMGLYCSHDKKRNPLGSFCQWLNIILGFLGKNWSVQCGQRVSKNCRILSRKNPLMHKAQTGSVVFDGRDMRAAMTRRSQIVSTKH